MPTQNPAFVDRYASQFGREIFDWMISHSKQIRSYYSAVEKRAEAINKRYGEGERTFITIIGLLIMPPSMFFGAMEELRKHSHVDQGQRNALIEIKKWRDTIGERFRRDIGQMHMNRQIDLVKVLHPKMPKVGKIDINLAFQYGSRGFIRVGGLTATPTHIKKYGDPDLQVPTITLQIMLPPDFHKRDYGELLLALKNTLKHELEHVYQPESMFTEPPDWQKKTVGQEVDEWILEEIERRSGIHVPPHLIGDDAAQAIIGMLLGGTDAMPTDKEIQAYTKEREAFRRYEYLMFPFEIDAWVTHMYDTAKREKLPVAQVMAKQLSSEGKHLSRSQTQDIKRAWNKRLHERYPRAKEGSRKQIEKRIAKLGGEKHVALTREIKKSFVAAPTGTSELLQMTTDGILRTEYLEDRFSTRRIFVKNVLAALKTGGDFSMVWPKYALWILKGSRYSILNILPKGTDQSSRTSRGHIEPHIKAITAYYEKMLRGEKTTEKEWRRLTQEAYRLHQWTAVSYGCFGICISAAGVIADAARSMVDDGLAVGDQAGNATRRAIEANECVAASTAGRSYMQYKLDAEKDYVNKFVSLMQEATKDRGAMVLAAKNPESARELIAKSRRLWDAYCARPSQARMKKVMGHCEAMKKSKAQSVSKERRLCARSASKEAQARGWA